MTPPHTPAATVAAKPAPDVGDLKPGDEVLVRAIVRHVPVAGQPVSVAFGDHAESNKGAVDISKIAARPAEEAFPEPPAGIDAAIEAEDAAQEARAFPAEEAGAEGWRLDEWERRELSAIALGRVLTYSGHNATGGLSDAEIGKMNKWRKLSDKLAAAPTPPVKP